MAARAKPPARRSLAVAERLGDRRRVEGLGEPAPPSSTSPPRQRGGATNARARDAAAVRRGRTRARGARARRGRRSRCHLRRGAQCARGLDQRRCDAELPGLTDCAAPPASSPGGARTISRRRGTPRHARRIAATWRRSAARCVAAGSAAPRTARRAFARSPTTDTSKSSRRRRRTHARAASAQARLDGREARPPASWQEGEGGARPRPGGGTTAASDPRTTGRARVARRSSVSLSARAPSAGGGEVPRRAAVGGDALDGRLHGGAGARGRTVGRRRVAERRVDDADLSAGPSRSSCGGKRKTAAAGGRRRAAERRDVGDPSCRRVAGPRREARLRHAAATARAPRRRIPRSARRGSRSLETIMMAPIVAAVARAAPPSSRARRSLDMRALTSTYEITARSIRAAGSSRAAARRASAGVPHVEAAAARELGAADFRAPAR